MKTEILTCDIQADEHSGACCSRKMPVMFDHDQEDGKSKTEPYFQLLTIEICTKHYAEVIDQRKLIYGRGAMGFNKYYFKQ